MMTKKVLTVMVCGLMLMTFAFSAYAGSAEITPQRVVETVQRAVKLIAEKGEKEAFPCKKREGRIRS